MRAIRLTGIIAFAVGCSVIAQVEERGRGGVTQPMPLADHHQHLFSPELAELVSATPPLAPRKPRTAADLIAQLDAAGIRRAVVLSAAHIFEQPSRNVDVAARKSGLSRRRCREPSSAPMHR